MKIIPLLKIHHCFEGLIVFVIPTFEMLYRTLSDFNEPVIVFTRYARYHKIGKPTKLSTSSIKTVMTLIEQPNNLTATWKNCNHISFTKHEQTNVFKLCSAPKSLPLGPEGSKFTNLIKNIHIIVTNKPFDTLKNGSKGLLLGMVPCLTNSQLKIGHTRLIARSYDYRLYWYHQILYCENMSLVSWDTDTDT